jgi:hypothetical protein
LFFEKDQPHVKNSKWRGGSARGDGGYCNRKMMMMSSSPCVSSSMVAASSSSNPLKGSSKKRQRTGSESISLDDQFVQCFLNITPMMFARDGYICISMGSCTRAKNSSVEVRNLYVYPQDVRICRDTQDWEDSLSHIVI